MLEGSPRRRHTHTSSPLRGNWPLELIWCDFMFFSVTWPCFSLISHTHPAQLQLSCGPPGAPIPPIWHCAHVSSHCLQTRCMMSFLDWNEREWYIFFYDCPIGLCWALPVNVGCFICKFSFYHIQRARTSVLWGGGGSVNIFRVNVCAANEQDGCVFICWRACLLLINVQSARVGQDMPLAS